MINKSFNITMLFLKKNKKAKGSVSIYLSLIFLSIVLLVSVIGESARVASVHAKAESVSSMAADSVMAGYARQIYDDYGILLVWNKQGVKSTLEQYIQANINMADIKVAGYDLMKMDVGDINVSNQVKCTDEGGDEFVKQVSSYLKFAGLTEAIKKIKKDSKKIKEEDSSNDVSADIDDDTDEIELISEMIDSRVKDLNKNEKIEKYTKRLAEVIKDKKSSKGKLKEAGKKLRREIDDIDADIDDVLDLIKDYQSVKKSLLKKHNQKNEKDYVDDNKILLKQISNKIQIIDEIDLNESDKPKFTNNIILLEQRATEIAGLLKKLKVSEVTKKDKKNNSLFKSVKELLDKGVLSLVISDKSKWSDKTINATDLPSKTAISKSKESSVWDKAALALYSYNYFGNYTDPKKDDVLEYGLEYIASGEDSDQSNLAWVVEELVAIRHVPNMVCLLSDKKKMGTINAIAASVALVTKLPFLEPIAKAVLVEAWTLAESVCDVRILLKGEKLSLIKKQKNWRTSLTNLFPKDEKGDSSGLKYIGYLEGLIMLLSREKIAYRVMDLIQMNACKKYNADFRMKDSVLAFKGKVKYYTSPLLAGMPWMVSMLGDSNGSFEFGVNVTGQYLE